MGVEIEHKYLVKDTSYRGMAEKRVSICQGYLSRDPARTVRIRTAGGKGFITVKGLTDSASRLEFEYEIPLCDAQELLQLCHGALLRKVRYMVPYRGFMWEVDEFCGDKAGLVVAEIELPAPGTVYETPPFIGDNVTGDKRYYNSNL